MGTKVLSWMGSGLRELGLGLDTGSGTAMVEKLPDLAWGGGERGEEGSMEMWASLPAQHLSGDGGAVGGASEDEVGGFADSGA